MKTHVIETTCDVCGGPGAATVQTSASKWMGGKIRHSDPQVCANYLKEKKRRLEEAEMDRNLGNNLPLGCLR